MAQGESGVEVQIEGGGADLPDQKGGNGNIVSQVADLIQEELIDKPNAADEISEGDNEKYRKDDVQKDHVAGAFSVDQDERILSSKRRTGKDYG
jgi:hypothetical protein